MNTHIYSFWTYWFWLVLQFSWTGFISGFNFGFMVLGPGPARPPARSLRCGLDIAEYNNLKY